MLSFVLIAAALSADVHLLLQQEDRLASDAARHIARQLDVPVVVETSTAPLDPRAVIRRCDHAITLLLDAAGGLINVVRCEDGVVLTRYFEPRSPESTAYAIAIASVELIDLAQRPPPPVKASPPPLVAERAASWSWSLSAGVGVSVGQDQLATLLVPRLGLDLIYRPSSLGLAIGLRAALFGRADGLANDGTGIEYRRHDLALRVGIDPEDVGWALGVLFGVSSASAGAFDVSGAALGSATRWPAFLGFGGELRHQIGGPLVVAIGAEVLWVLAPADYLVRGAAVTSDGDVRALAHLSFLWEPSR